MKTNPDYFGHFGFEDSGVMTELENVAWELGADQYSDNVKFSEFAMRAYKQSSLGFEHEIQSQELMRSKLRKKPKQSIVPTLADTITLISLGLGLWWAAGGPVWAGLLSILGDELDGRVARATNTCSARGSALDWGTDVALTSASLLRLGLNTGHLTSAIVAAPIFLFAQAQLRSNEWRPPVGSARAVIMISTMVIGKRV